MASFLDSCSAASKQVIEKEGWKLKMRDASNKVCSIDILFSSENFASLFIKNLGEACRTSRCSFGRTVVKLSSMTVPLGSISFSSA